jgi:purine-binding chemotaxis protein CheW
MRSVTEEERQIATFNVGKLRFGIDVLLVQEVLRYQNMTRVPLAPNVVEGLINLRGQIITALDMRRILGMEPMEDQNLRMNVVVQTPDDTVSLLVDAIDDVLPVSAGLFEGTPPTLPLDYQRLLKGVYKLSNGLLLELDPAKIYVD